MAQSYLVYGGERGWLGQKLVKLLEDAGKKAIAGKTRLENRESLIKEIEAVKPTHVLNAAGVTGRPNVDWCESHKEETLRSNVIGTLNLADVCNMRGIHLTVYATGCIFSYDESNPDHSIGGRGFVEEDSANFDGSFYSYTKGMVEPMLATYPKVMILRVRMPISDDLSARNFVTKITKYERVVNIPNSMTVLSELLPYSLLMAEKNLTGIYNFCNPGAISHNEILEMYKKYIDPSFTYTNFTEEEQNKILVGKRSNNKLCHQKLQAAVPEVELDEIHQAMHKCFERMHKNLVEDGTLPDKLPKRSKTS